jgi:hypothetical protein
MARKGIHPIDGQFTLFNESGQPYEIQTDEPYTTTYGPEGSYIEVGKRSALLESSLLALGKRNQRLGFDVASRTKPYSGPIWGRYEEITPIVIEGAQRNVYDFLDVAKKDFWAATGFAALRKLGSTEGLMKSDEIDARGRKMWRDFTHKYGDPQVRTQRDNYRKQLKKAIRNSNEIVA